MKIDPSVKSKRVMRILSSFMALSTCFAQQSIAASFSQNRFTSMLNTNIKVLKAFTQANPDLFEKSALDISNLAVESNIRQATFQVQALARVYSGYPNPEVQATIDRIFRSSKRQEDLIGTYEKWAMNQHQEKAAEEAETLAFEMFGVVPKDPINLKNAGQPNPFIEKNGATPKLDSLKAQVQLAPWLDESSDRKFVLRSIANMLIEIQTKDYAQMSLLEAGLHEIRRDLRWIPIASVSLAGLLQTSNAGQFACDKEQKLNFSEAGKADSARYGLDKFAGGNEVLPKDVCVISQCLYEEIVGAVGVFGKLKDKAEPVVLANPVHNDVTPPEIAELAKVQYTNLIKSEAAVKLANQIESCVQK